MVAFCIHRAGSKVGRGCNDPTRSLGSLAEPECRGIIGAIDIAAREGLPIEWIAVSSAARIAMDSGSENLDWPARVLRRIVEATQAGLEINLIVCGVNVGAQAYWNAQATMLMHTRGTLIMTHDGAMVVTGKKALEYSGSVSAEDAERFKRILRAVLLISLLVALVMPWLPVREPDRTVVVPVPASHAKLLLEREPAPPTPLPKAEKQTPRDEVVTRQADTAKAEPKAPW